MSEAPQELEELRIWLQNLSVENNRNAAHRKNIMDVDQSPSENNTFDVIIGQRTYRVKYRSDKFGKDFMISLPNTNLFMKIVNQNDAYTYLSSIVC